MPKELSTKIKLEKLLAGLACYIALAGLLWFFWDIVLLRYFITYYSQNAPANIVTSILTGGALLPGLLCYLIWFFKNSRKTGVDIIESPRPWIMAAIASAITLVVLIGGMILADFIFIGYSLFIEFQGVKAYMVVEAVCVFSVSMLVYNLFKPNT